MTRGPLRLASVLLAANLAACQVPSTVFAPTGEPVVSTARLKAKPQPRRHIAVGFRSLPAAATLKQLFGGLPVTVRKTVPAAHAAIVTPTGTADKALIKRLSGLPGVEYAEWEGVGSVMSTVMDAQAARPMADTDPRRKDQWALDKIRAAEAWTLTKGRQETVIAIVDTGIDPRHPDLAPKLVPGFNAAEPGQATRDDFGHGTHVAGIAGAMTGNGVGIAGIAPAARLMPIKVNLSESASLEESAVADGIVWAANHGADVINLSLGFSAFDGEEFRTLGRAVYHALSKDCVVVAAMGNDFEAFGANHPSYPAAWSRQSSLRNLITVSATKPDDSRWARANTGPWITLSAPGFGILSTMPTYKVPMTGLKEPANGNDLRLNYGTMSGTSMATPLVSGVAALLLSRMNNHEPGLVKLKLQSAVDRLGDPALGAGRLNALDALRGL